MFKWAKKRDKKIQFIFAAIIGFSLISNQCVSPTMSATAFLNIVYDYKVGEFSLPEASPYIGLYVAEFLRLLGIEVEVKVEEWTNGMSWPPYGPDIHSELSSLKIPFQNREPDFNLIQEIPYWVYHTDYDFPYKAELLEMIEVGPTIESKEERKYHYQKLQELFLDKILLFWPLIVEHSYECMYNNTKGYDSKWGWVDSSPYMYYDGFHPGQNSLDEFIFYHANWKQLNPLFLESSSSRFISDFSTDTLIAINPEGVPTRNGLISNWIELSSDHYQFFLRPNVYWNPSFNITTRNDNSPPLQDAICMNGLQGTNSTGNNQLVTAKDAIFTLLSWSNPIVSTKSFEYEWLTDIYVDPINPLSFHIHLDGNPETNVSEYYSLLFNQLEIACLPEFFLNSTADIVTYTSTGIRCEGLYDGIEETPEWHSFAESAFGCGKFMLDYAIDNKETVLRRSPYWHGIGKIDGSTGITPFVETVKIRVIPDSSAALEEFKAGKLDWVDLTRFRNEREEMEENPLYQIFVPGTYFMSVLVFNSFGSNWADLNFDWITETGYENYTKLIAIKKAICHAIDRKEIGKDLYSEYGLSDCLIPPQLTEWYCTDIQTKYEYDPLKALTWFKRAGFNVTIPSELTETSTLPYITTINLSNSLTVFGLISYVILLRRRKLKLKKKEF